MDKARIFNKIVSFLTHRDSVKLVVHKMCTVSSVQVNSEKSPSDGERMEQLFASQPVQRILQDITGLDVDKIYKTRMYGSGKMRRPRYQFMTDEEYQKALEKANHKARKLLLMPPFLHLKPDEPTVISKDPEIQGFLKTKLIGIDISPGFNYKNRLIVVREPDGILREANKKERTLTNQVYFPRSQREIYTPTFFQAERLQAFLNKGDYRYVLERSCIQFEPDDPEFIRVTETVYKHVDSTREFDVLRSTRFFGPMAFYLTRNKSIDNLLIDMLKSLLVDDAANLVKLYYIIHQPDKSNELQGDENIQQKVKFMKGYALEASQNKGALELVLQSVLDLPEKERMVGH